MVEFLHAADFHLDSPFASLSPERAAERRRENRALLGRMAEYVLKQADGAEYAEEAIIAGADKITLRIRIGADINPNLAVLMINGGKPQNVVLAELPTDGEGYLYECNVTEAMDELGAVYVNVCDDATNAINYVSAQVYKYADALDALVKGMMETIKSQGGEDEISWRYADDAE